MPELLAVAILLLLAAVIATLAIRRRPAPGAALALVAATTGGVLLAAAVSHREPPAPPQPPHVPLARADAGYTTSRACRSCHPYQYETWHASYHRTMTQRASPEAVIGDFDDVLLDLDGARYHLFEQGGRFFGEASWSLPGGGTESIRVPLEQTTGSHHMQIYWYPTGEGRLLQSFPLVYLREQQRWVPRLAAFVTPPQPGPTPPSVWNVSCLGCHTTGARPRIERSELDIEAADTRITELGIACEACHGPGGPHADAHRSPTHRWATRASGEPDPTIVNPGLAPGDGGLSHVRSAQVCGQCHSVKTFFSEEHAVAWEAGGWTYRPGEDLEAAASLVSNETLDRPFTRQILEEYPDFLRGSFWDDGIVRVTGREYNALREAPCFQRGEMSCTSCHALHRSRDDERPLPEWANDQLAPSMDTDRACLQCHERFSDDRAVADHSNHPADSSGSRCLNCHMPHTSYGLLKAVRAHDIGNPTAVAGDPARPNACNLCHLDRSVGWTAEHLERWYGQPPPDLSDDERHVAAGARWALQGDAGVRALVAWSMGWEPAQQAAGTGWLVPYLSVLMQDPYDAVRLIATRSLRGLPGLEAAAFDELAPPRQRARAARALVDAWSLRPESAAGRSEATLFDPDGGLDAAEVERLLAGRDRRPVNLQE